MAASSSAVSTAVDDRVKHWLGEIAAARKREKDWRKEGRRVLDIYNGKKKEQIPFNILYSNTETLLPALYNSQPRPVVQRRFKDADPVGKASSTAAQRLLEFTVDTNSEEYASFDDSVTDAVVDGLLPGRGATRIRYDADIQGAEGQRYVKSELVCFDSVKWDRWVFGFAKKWKKVPWIAFEHDVTLDEAKELFGEAIAAKLTFQEQDHSGDKEDDDSERNGEKTDEDRKIAKVWEIWHKTKKRVLFVSPNYSGGYLKEDDDPLQLTGFYPMPEPLRFLRKSNDQMPTALYSLYENQAKELNRLSVRINRVAEAMKVRGAYDGSLGELGAIFKAEDNVLIAAENVAALQEGGLEKAIWLVPIEKLITVLQQLYIARNNCKQVIYEITGISDILRGSTVASETATAQQIKSQWGTLRLKRLQREVMRYTREMLRIATEIAANKFQEKTWAMMTGLPFTTTEQAQAAQGQVAAARSMIAQRNPQAVADPQAMQQAMMQSVPQALQALQAPQWAAILKMLKNDTQRQYRIDIETNSTVDLEATEDQKNMQEILGAIGQFLQAVGPLVVNGSMPFQVAQSMLLGIVRRYRFGTEVEDYIQQMQPPQNPDAGKQQAEQAKAAAEQQRAQEQHQMDIQTKKLDLQARERELQMEAEFKREEHQLRMAELQGKLDVARIMAQVKLQEAQNKLALAKEHAALDLAKEKELARHQVAAAAAKGKDNASA